MNPVDPPVALLFHQEVISKKPIVFVALLGVGLGVYGLANREPEPQTRCEPAPAPTVRAAKIERRDDASLSLDGGASLKIESALERSSPEKALEGFGELAQAWMRNQAESIALMKQLTTPDFQDDPRFRELEDRGRDLNGRINVARAALIDQGVDHAAVDAIFEEQHQRVARAIAIRELEEELKKHPRATR